MVAFSSGYAVLPKMDQDLVGSDGQRSATSAAVASSELSAPVRGQLQRSRAVLGGADFGESSMDTSESQIGNFLQVSLATIAVSLFCQEGKSVLLSIHS